MITMATMYIPHRDSTSTHYKTVDTDMQHCIRHITNITYSTHWGSNTDDHTDIRWHQQLRPYNTKHRHTNQSDKPYNRHIHQRSPPCLTRYTTIYCGQLNTYYHVTTYQSSTHSTYDITTDCNKTDGHLKTTRKKRLDTIFPKTESPITLRPRYTPTYTLPI